ncbi:hypothetical protein [Streptomyces sp. CBMA123]|uniref:hypothetical protein n=1 Tax=Streptomyces sp. CBMA123 TaxID=1896313 RepID=UPI001661B67A|nr:hypothetical protein [Streptomyces sp. CBMA123]MBD0689658.1 hypothetical protein [Streptomyces sp. CBMA123]
MAVELVLDPYAFEEICRTSPELEAALLRICEGIARRAMALAPYRNRARHWNTIKRQFEVRVARGEGLVVIEPDHRVRHVLLLNFGFTDSAGKRHAGSHFLEAALREARSQ